MRTLLSTLLAARLKAEDQAARSGSMKDIDRDKLSVEDAERRMKAPGF